MRTTLELDDDLVHAAKQLARQRGTTLGQTVSGLMRQGLKPRDSQRIRNGVRRSRSLVRCLVNLYSHLFQH